MSWLVLFFEIEGFVRSDAQIKDKVKGRCLYQMSIILAVRV